MTTKILIIEDCPEFVELLCATLEGVFDEINCASDVDEACLKTTQKTYDLILLDINLKNRNGGEVLNFLKESPENANKKTPVIISSGIVDNKFKEVYQSKFAAIFVKPYRLDDLKKTCIDLIKFIPREDISDVDCTFPFEIEGLSESYKIIIEGIRKNNKHKGLFRQIRPDFKNGNYLLIKAGIIINVASAICKELDLYSEVNLRKFVYASYLHDLALSTRQDLAKILLNSDFKEKMNSLSIPENKIVQEHPNISAHMTNEISDMPADVEVMIRSHHEMPDGSGFPAALLSQKINPLTAIFIVSLHFTEYVMNNERWTVEEFSNKYKKQFKTSYFQKALWAIENL